jgi:hypothetical protein
VFVKGWYSTAHVGEKSAHIGHSPISSIGEDSGGDYVNARLWWFVLDDAGECVLEGHTDEHHCPAIVTVKVDPLSDLAPAPIQNIAPR